MTSRDVMLDAQAAEIRRLRDIADKRQATIRQLKQDVASLPDLRRRLKREQSIRWRQHQRAELWKHRALNR